MLNQIRRANPALQSDLSLHFHATDNPQLIAYSKSTPNTDNAPANTILVIVNLDPLYEQTGFVDLDLQPLGLTTDESFDVEDLLTGNRYHWSDQHNYVSLNPAKLPAHIFRIAQI